MAPHIPTTGTCPKRGRGAATWCLSPRQQDSIQRWLSGHSAQHRAAEAHIMIPSPKPQAVPASVKCDLSRAAAQPLQTSYLYEMK